MVISLDTDELEYSIQNIADVARGIADWQDDGSAPNVHDAIKRALRQEVQEEVVNRARRYAEPHVGAERAVDIAATDVSGTTNLTSGGTIRGDYTYSAGLETSNIVVMSHETGSGKYGTRGTYEITPRDPDGVLAFHHEGRFIVTKVVRHPGVRGKRFMYRAIREQADKIAREARDNAQQALIDSIEHT